MYIKINKVNTGIPLLTFQGQTNTCNVTRQLIIRIENKRFLHFETECVEKKGRNNLLLWIQNLSDPAELL